MGAAIKQAATALLRAKAWENDKRPVWVKKIIVCKWGIFFWLLLLLWAGFEGNDGIAERGSEKRRYARYEVCGEKYSTGEQQQDIQVTAIEQNQGWQSTVKVARAGRTFYLNKCVWNMSVSVGGWIVRCGCARGRLLRCLNCLLGSLGG